MKFNILALTRDILFICIALYLGQGALYAQSLGLGQFFLVIVLLISGLFFIKIHLLKFKKPLYFTVFTVFLLLNVFGYLFTGDFSNNSHFEMLKSILFAALPFYPFYYFTIKGALVKKHLTRFFFIILPISILSFYNNQAMLIAESYSGNVVNNAAYTFVSLIPFVFLIKKNKLLSYIILLILVFFIVQGAKRGALITGSIGVIFFLYYQLKNIDYKHRFRSYFFTVTGIVLIIYFTLDYYQNNPYLIKRLNELGESGGSSGRDVIYSDIYNAWYNTENIFHFLFGFGFAGSLQLNSLGLYAHNDWLELLSNFGLLGVGLYLLLFFASFKIVYNNRKENSEQNIMLLSIILMWFAITLFSMGYTNTGTIFQTLLIAFILGNNKIIKINT